MYAQLYEMDNPYRSHLNVLESLYFKQDPSKDLETECPKLAIVKFPVYNIIPMTLYKDTINKYMSIRAALTTHELEWLER